MNDIFLLSLVSLAAIIGHNQVSADTVDCPQDILTGNCECDATVCDLKLRSQSVKKHNPLCLFSSYNHL